MNTQQITKLRRLELMKARLKAAPGRLVFPAQQAEFNLRQEELERQLARDLRYSDHVDLVETIMKEQTKLLRELRDHLRGKQ